MKRFMTSKFVLAVKGVSSLNADFYELENWYDEFVSLLFLENALSTDKVAYHNSLLYTRVELAYLTEVSGKKYCNLS